MNGPNNPWVRLIVSIFLGAVTLQLIVQMIRPYVPYILAVIVIAAIAAIVAAVRWWRERW